MATPTINLTEFLPLVRPHTPGAAIPSMTQALRRSAIEFCERTRCWRETITITITEQDQAITAPDDSAIHEIERAEFDGERLTPIEYDDLSLPEFLESEEGRPAVITQKTYNEIAIVPFRAGTLICTLFLKPRDGENITIDAGGQPANSFNTVPEFLLSRFGEAIAAGAIARVLIIPQQPFTNPEMAAVHAGRFEQGVARFNGANVRGQHRARPRINASFF